MKGALYCYWGCIGDHNLNIPGHPLYQLFFLKVLKKKFDVDEFGFFSFLKPRLNPEKYDISRVRFFIREEKRRSLLEELSLKYLRLRDVLERIRDYDYIFVKARFRNKSRMEEKSYDALKFEEILKRADLSRVYVIDSDGELPRDFFRSYDVGVITYFYYADDFYRDKGYSPPPREVIALPPALTEDFPPTHGSGNTLYDVFFIGNYGLKQPHLVEWLEKAHEDGLRVAVQGKWPPRFHFKVYPRTAREKAYRDFEKSLSSIQISKEKYSRYSFLSPRVYESAIVGRVCFTEPGYVCSTPFLTVESYREFRERVLTLRQGFERDYPLVWKEFIDRLREVEESLI